MKKGKNSKKEKKILVGFWIVLLIILIVAYSFNFSFEEAVQTMSNDTLFLASTTSLIDLYAFDEKSGTLVKNDKIIRGNSVVINGKYIKNMEKKYYLVTIKGINYYINENNLVKNLEEVVLEKVMYVRTTTSILKDTTTSQIIGLAEKGDALEIVGYDELDNDGNVITYKIRKDNIEGYVYGKYLVENKEEALKTYNEQYDEIYKNIKNSFGGGEASALDYYPNEKVSFENNKMPDSVYALYLNAGSNVINNIDSYIEFAKDTKINAFVIDIKDNESPAYPARTFLEFSKTNYDKAINSYNSYKEAVTKLKEAGFYVIGRITTFEDSYYVQDNPGSAISSKSTGLPYLHNKSYWPSAYDREVWYYNVSLAKEAVVEFGFNEINFDYVRFPDRMQSVENSVDLKNEYNEDKTQAIQRFVQYATDELHKLNVYVSIDVFGETTNGTYTTAYGQYWPAISNICDVISGMPYPDHFSDGYYGISKPWNNPYKLMNMWGRFASDRQKETPTPAVVRTWVQAYDVMKYVDNNGISYGALEVEAEIRGLYDADLTGGYVTWLSNSSLEKYNTQKKAFQIDYGSEYNE